jgi:hypothetical protein
VGGGRPSRSVFASRLLLDALSLKKKKYHSDEQAVCLCDLSEGCLRLTCVEVDRLTYFQGPLPNVNERNADTVRLILQLQV